MNTTHDFHRLAHNGFKGLARIERDRRIDAFLVKVGEWAIAFFLGAVLATCSMSSAHAADGARYEALACELVGFDDDGMPEIYCGAVAMKTEFTTAAACKAWAKAKRGAIQGEAAKRYSFVCVRESFCVPASR